MKQVKVGSLFAPLLTLPLCVCPFLTRLKFRRILGPAGFLLFRKIADRVWELLKVSKNRIQIFQQKLLPKTEPSNLFFYPDK